MAMHLSALGVRVDEITLVPDDPGLLVAAIQRAISAAAVVLVSGGLGPTADDFTVAALSRVFGRRIHRDPESEARMRSRALARGVTEDKLPPNYWKQAEVLEGAEVLINPVGLAPGMILATERGFLAALPGVPKEMQALFLEKVLPALRERLDLVEPRILRAKIMGIGESWAEARIQKLRIDFQKIEYGISAKPGELLVKFISHDPQSHEHLDEVRRLLQEEFREDAIFLPEGLLDAAGSPVAVEHALIVHELLLKSGKTVATAESCTGGLVAKLLTDRPGSSAYFLGSVVAYHDSAKENLLEVPRETIEKHGSVSAETCEAMARGVLRRFGADIGIAITGIAGPTGATPGKPVGLVYMGLGTKAPAKVQVERAVFWGDRENVRTLAAVRALDLIRREIGKAGAQARSLTGT
jgi:nicotinamide-nucleotide amidase